MKSRPSFFVGYLPAPPDVRRLMLGVGLAVGLGFALLAIALGRTPVDVGPSRFGDELQIAGVFLARPYPVVFAPADADHPNGRAMMLGGDGKHGAQEWGARFEGRGVVARGAVVKRGDLDMLLVGDDESLTPAPRPISAPEPAPLGRWRIAGEICDGKCAAGAMRPGTGLAHKACANLCIAGGLPPVLVSATPVEGRFFLLLGDADGGPAPATIADLVGLPVTLEGDVERRGDMLVFRVDWTKAARQ